MPVENDNFDGRRLLLPYLCLVLVLLGLAVSMYEVHRASLAANEHAEELHQAWQSFRDGTQNGSGVLATDVTINQVVKPLPTIVERSLWSLGLGIATVLCVCWIAIATSRVLKHKAYSDNSDSAAEHDAMIALVEEVSPIFRGDLRQSATASTDTSGALANAFNHALSELRWLVETMESSSDKLKKTIEGSRESAGNVSIACAEQSRQIHKSSNYLFSMSATMSGLSADAAESSLAAQTAVDRAEAGADALRASLHTLSAIRDEADGTTRVMHRLANNVSAIDDCITVIQDVAKQTDLLALNTTIRASAGSRSASASSTAADLGRLSDEVAQLAEILGQATRDISSLTRTITEDASDTVQSMEHITMELAAGVGQTQHASDGLDIIQSSARELHERVLLMTDRCVEQSGIVRQLTEHMDQINQITDQTVDAVTLNSESLGELQTVATELRLRTLNFRLPEKRAFDADSTQSSSKARRAAERAVNA